MKASEIIKLLQNMINLHGDKEVFPQDDAGFFTHIYPLEKIYLGERDGKQVFELTTGVGT